MEYFEYPKRVDERTVVNTKEEEIEYLKSKGIKSGDLCTFSDKEGIFELSNEVTSNDKKDEAGVSSEIGKGEEPQQAESIEETSKETPNGSGDVQTHGQESPIGILKRKAGRPKRK